MTVLTSDLVIVGAGPAGLEAALTAAEEGVEVTLLDRYPRPGGQYYLQPAFDQLSSGGVPLLEQFQSAPISYQPDTAVWGAFPDHKSGCQLGAIQNDLPIWLKAQALILACGAYERPTPFPGWTRPGVYPAGAIQNMIKHQALVPPGPILLSGWGPILFTLAAELLDQGAELAGICHPHLQLKGIGQLAGSAVSLAGRIPEGLKAALRLLRHRVPVYWGYQVISAESLPSSKATIARLNPAGNPIPETREDLPTACLICHTGFQANNHLSRMLNCRHYYSPEFDTWVPQRNGSLESSQPMIYLAGDMAGIQGVNAARIEGKIAGLAAARALGAVSGSTADLRLRRLRRQRDQETLAWHRIRNLFSAGYRPLNLKDTTTILCRCEDITFQEVQQQIQAGADTPTAIKNSLRAGMGSCQGYICETLVEDLLSTKSAHGHKPASRWSIRPPLFPLPLGLLAEADNQLP